MNTLTLGNTEARRIFLDRHMLSGPPHGLGKGDDLLGLIRDLGFVQLDSINTVARAHDLILFSRRQRYRPNALKVLYEKDRALFEHWTHDASVVPLEYYPYWELRRRRDAAVLRGRYKQWRGHEFEAQCKTVLDQIRERGPVCSSTVGEGEARSSGGWWEWHPSKTALEYLWRAGALCVVRRQGFQKHYDLTERVLETQYCDATTHPDDAETINWCCSGALDRLGFATHGEIAAFWAHVKPAEAKDWCASEVAAGRLQSLQITGADGSLHASYCRPELAEDPARHIAPTDRLRVLSPFDPALRDRKRAERLFGFSYRVEMFVPAPKRTYGYYVFPLLQGDRLVGRVDMKAFRDKDQLVVQALWPEPGVKWGKGRQTAFETELNRLIKLAGVGQISFANGWLRS